MPPPTDPEIRNEVVRLLKAGVPQKDIATRCGVARSTIGRVVKAEGLQRSPRKYDWIAIQSYHDGGHNIADCCRKFGMSRAAFREAADRGELCYNPPTYRPFETKNTSYLRAYLLREDLLPYVCECGQQPEWNSKPLTLQLHHRNGDSSDHRLENLMFLCPNCHTQTDTYAVPKSRRDTLESVSEAPSS